MAPVVQATTKMMNNQDLRAKILTTQPMIPSHVYTTFCTHSAVVAVLPSQYLVASAEIPETDNCTPKLGMEDQGEVNKPKTWKYMLKFKALPVRGVYAVALPAVHSTRLFKTVLVPENI